jgi:cytoskeletal protein RodZ
MKKTLMIFAAIVMMAGFTTTVMAQTSATVAATPAGAQLIVPMTLGETSPLHFGTITLLNASGGTVSLTTTNTRNFTGGVATSAVLPTSTNAAYNVTGTYNETYALTLPATIEVKETVGNTAVMTISALTVKFLGGSEVSGYGATAVSILSVTGTDSFIVGGTLTVAASQIGGIYAGTFAVSVDYN